MELIDLIPNFGNILYTLGAFIIALLIIIAVHEYGHYIVGRWSGIHAEVFSLGFGPVLWSRLDKHGTRWQIAALPLGGFVRFMGESSASSGKDSEAIEALSEKDKRRSMHSAPLWARAVTVAAGPAANFILSILVFGAVLGAQGVATDPLTIAELRPVPTEQGLRVGDEILAIAGMKTPVLDAFDGYIDSLPIAAVLDYTVRRDGREITVQAPYPYPSIVAGLAPGSAAMDADLRVGDVILSADGVPVPAFSTLRDIVGNSGGKSISFEIWRDGEVSEATIVPRSVDLPLQEGGFETRWLIGITGSMIFVPETAPPGVSEALRFGANQTIYIIRSSVSGLYHMIAGSISSCNLRGPIGIAQTSGAAASQGLASFVWFIAVLSTAVGFLNLFPIPVLDGGHLMFHVYEAVAGKPPSDGALRILMAVGLVLILSLMIFAISNDLFCP
ncbi:MAG: RIP metalloprotease RseP [Paracoccaceae bacterium]